MGLKNLFFTVAIFSSVFTTICLSQLRVHNDAVYYCDPLMCYSGKPFTGISYRENKPDRDWSASFANSSAGLDEFIFEDGIQIGKISYYHGNGKKKEESVLGLLPNSSLMSVLSKTYYWYNGNKQNEAKWEHNDIHSSRILKNYRSWYYNGQLKLMYVHFNDGDILKQCWDENGNKIENCDITHLPK
tara:strand:- start:96 stop:656 length:561 start_codon:yes stop_codon:yes gene_type:complete